jgi:hypothetical protein
LTLRKRRYYWNIRERTIALRLVISFHSWSSNSAKITRLMVHGVSLKTKNVSMRP